jgi:hypothetical protein
MRGSCPNEEMRSAIGSLTNSSSSIIEIMATFDMSVQSVAVADGRRRRNCTCGILRTRKGLVKYPLV